MNVNHPVAHQRPSTWVAQCLVPSPLGAIRLATTQQGLGGCWFEDQAHHPGVLNCPDKPKHPTLSQAIQALDAYWLNPQVTHWFDINLDPTGTAFQHQVWTLLRGIAPGQSLSYSDLARLLNKPKAARAIGAAVGRNPLSLFIPCHRVIGQNGALTGYAGGLARKQALLQAEGHSFPTTSDNRQLTLIDTP